MKKYNLICKFEKDHYTVVCPSLFGFILYVKNKEDIKKEALRVLKLYTSNEKISEGNLNIKQEKEEELIL